MNNNLEIDKVIIKPGERKNWEINVNSRISDSVKIPITTINGKKDGPTLCVTAGVHPTEYSCIEAALQISREININNLSGNRNIIYSDWNNLLENRETYTIFPEIGDIYYSLAGNEYNFC